MAPIATTTGAIRRYGTEARSSRSALATRRRRGSAPAATVAVGGVSGTARRRSGVEDGGDVVAGRGRRLLDGELAGQDLGEHVAQDVAVLDVDPVLGSRHEPAAAGGALVDPRRVEQVRRVRDVADRLQGLLGG